MEFSLLWAALTAVAAAWAGLHLWEERLPEHAADRLLTATLVGLVVGRLTAMVVQGVNPLTNPAEIIVVRGGVDTTAATVGFVTSLVWSTRWIPGVVDAVAPAVLAGVSGWHAGCLWRGACLGTPSDLAWAWAQTGSEVTRHPVEIYAAIALLLGAFLVSRLGWRPWLRAGTALAVASTVRLMTEPLRPSLGGGPVGWYVVGVILGALIAVGGPYIESQRTTAPT